jgi:hypothetical protein
VNGNCAAEATSQPEKCSDYDSQTRFPTLCTVWRPERNYSRQPDSGERSRSWMLDGGPGAVPRTTAEGVADHRFTGGAHRRSAA